MVPKLIHMYSTFQHGLSVDAVQERLSTTFDRWDKSVEVNNIDISHCVVHFGFTQLGVMIVIVLYYADVLLRVVCGSILCDPTQPNPTRGSTQGQLWFYCAAFKYRISCQFHGSFYV